MILVTAAAATLLTAAPVSGQAMELAPPPQSDDTTFSFTMPGPRFFRGEGAVLSITAIGPVEGTRIVATTFDIAWNSDGTMPASELEIVLQVMVDDDVSHVAVTGEDLGFGDGPGVWRGTYTTADLNGEVWQPPIFEHSIMNLSIDRAGGGGVQGRGFFINSQIVFDVIPAGAVATSETFEDGTNDAGWSYGTGNEVIEPAGGNPGQFLFDPFVVSFGPGASTAPGVESDFTGNYVARGVIGLGVDLKTFNVFGNVSGRKLSVIVWNDNDTPFDFDDDWGAYFIGPKPVPQVIAVAGGVAGWERYDFVVPADDSRVPDGWTVFGAQGGQVWQDLMNDVSGVEFFYGDPGVPQIILQWSVGLDNPRIYTRGD
jgi:hypothetical protein